MKQAMPLAEREGNSELVAGRPSDRRVLSEVSTFFENFARILLGNRGWREAWRLQYLTDLAVLPDYEPGWRGHHAGLQGAPVDQEGNPVFYTVPPSFDASADDGQRWRWSLEEAVKLSSVTMRKNDIKIEKSLAPDLPQCYADPHLIEQVGDARWSVGALPLGSGRVKSAHGMLPIPAPAVTELLQGFVVHDDGLKGERVTPTGAAILCHLEPDSGGHHPPAPGLATQAVTVQSMQEQQARLGRAKANQ